MSHAPVLVSVREYVDFVRVPPSSLVTEDYLTRFFSQSVLTLSVSSYRDDVVDGTSRLPAPCPIRPRALPTSVTFYPSLSGVGETSSPKAPRLSSEFNRHCVIVRLRIQLQNHPHHVHQLTRTRRIRHRRGLCPLPLTVPYSRCSTADSKSNLLLRALMLKSNK